jgi:DNA-binding transcriptional MerR regulator
MNSKPTKEPPGSRRGGIWSDGSPPGSPEIEAGTVTIGELAAEFDVTPRTLRFYEKKGLLRPRREGAVRLYDARDRKRLALVLQGKRLAFTLAEILDMVAAQEKHNDAHVLEVSRERCLEQINLLERQKRTIEAALSELRRIYSSFYVKRTDDDRSR